MWRAGDPLSDRDRLMVTAERKHVEFRRPPMYPMQERSIFAPERFSIIEASTKSGKTVGCIAWLVEQAIRTGKPGRNYWWVAPIMPQARIAYTRMARFLERKTRVTNESRMTIRLFNGTTIWFKSADNPDSLYGEDVYAAVIDEASRCQEEAWHAVRSTLTATRAPCRIIGNVKGRKNWAYRMARRAEAGETDWHYGRITAQDAVEGGVLDQAEIEGARRDLPENVFKELYEAEASDDEGNPFGITAIREAVTPMHEGHATVWGWDLAKSIDWTWGVALNVDGNPVESIRFQLPWERTIGEILVKVGGTPALVDSTGVGDPVIERLQREQPGVFEGYKFTSTSKQQLMEDLAVAIQRREIGIPEGPLVAELEAFEYEYTRTGVRYSAPTGMHDDGVMAIALANYHLRHAPTQGIF